VQISTAGVSNALIVPVTALVPQNGGGYAVETVDARGIHHLVPVTLGLFDDADGLVQVMSQHLSAGQPIVVPAT
jgi:multidrug efflux pump subunit AcrA (membrane-fusion protein)